MNTLLLNALLLFFAASLHEDVAIVMAAVFVLDDKLPLVFALGVVYVGSVLNNYAIYGLGMLARHLPGLRRRLIGEKVEHMRQRVKRNLASTMTVCRVIPGSLSPFILGCGWLGVPFARFALTVALTAAVYVVVVAALVFTFGQAVIQQLTRQPWLIVIVVAAAVLFLAARYAGKLRVKSEG
jgi:membrane protein DedA with SNARE-associated domain